MLFILFIDLKCFYAYFYNFFCCAEVENVACLYAKHKTEFISVVFITQQMLEAVDVSALKTDEGLLGGTKPKQAACVSFTAFRFFIEVKQTKIMS